MNKPEVVDDFSVVAVVDFSVVAVVVEMLVSGVTGIVLQGPQPTISFFVPGGHFLQPVYVYTMMNELMDKNEMSYLYRWGFFVLQTLRKCVEIQNNL